MMRPSPTMASTLLFYVLVVCLPRLGTGLYLTQTPPLLNVPTYSMATLNNDSTTTNMNILTYATPVSVSPHRVWTLGLYKGTLSYENFARSGTCVLQLLADEHIPLVTLLGGSSGRDVDKQAKCAELAFKWEQLIDTSEIMLLPGCTFYICLSAIGDLADAGSHCIANCRVEETYAITKENQTWNPYLSTGKLREIGVITEQGRVAD